MFPESTTPVLNLKTENFRGIGLPEGHTHVDVMLFGS